ncbi:FAD-binding and (Fe-S)-binding domain-containing protein [Niveispirillum sp.]|uniref:FAD-binding and (Fe-S)-binding domain-containing protein n=1 Tax=Niveispirillum sp. TaxID=1917217 RepID=UPI001B5145BE|nr:FAD-binding and (Fe-S)-binding domain-containing protein [Niveispirillum sp.]MBP7336564.1 FAD-binding oxidoreductase [Niveispirillum sp.]
MESIARFLAALRDGGYRGDIADDDATRTVFATDNSIYQRPPAAVLFPCDGEDIALIVRLAASAPDGPIPLAPRGGGTGTNGQSLTAGVVIDTSHHMNRIEGLDLERLTVTVQPGVVLNQLNAFLRPHGLFFPPTVSTASRATLGGMVATDASGKGSRIYGKTSDYIEEMEVVLADGSSHCVRALDRAALRLVLRQDDLAGRLYREVHRVVSRHRDLIAEVFPRMNRGLTGYNLQNVVGGDGMFRLHYLLAGSEGTLAVTTRLILRVRPIPACRALVGIRYGAFDGALADIERLLATEPAAIEILDDKILRLARQDPVWTDIDGVLGGPATSPVGGLNIVEFVADGPAQLDRALGRLSALLDAGAGTVLDWAIVRDPATIAQLWSLREKAVGLLGRLDGLRQGTPFVEDAAVPPERLVDFITGFRAILDGHGLGYGMFGHADVGCLHVRPALDMRDPADAALIRPISDAVAALAAKHGGLLWGEHGRGFRGEYSPLFFGPVLYAEICRIKRAADPLNLLNPGKLTSPDAAKPVDRIDGVPFRGGFDRQIGPSLAQPFEKAIACNSNGACFNWDADDAMCPSYKVTRDRRQSPKGRAALLREWARLKSRPTAPDTLEAFEGEVHAALATCLSCKACAGQCPVKVDIPSMRSRFLHAFHQRRRRPLRDHLVARLEMFLPVACRLPGVANLLLRWASGPLRRRFGLIDLPRIDPAKGGRSPSSADLAIWSGFSQAEKARTVLLLEDTFTGSFDGATVHAVRDLLSALGFRVHQIAARPNGKALHVLGILDRFAGVAQAARDFQGRLLETGLPVIGIEPVALLMQDHEYRQDAPPRADGRRILALEDFLAGEIAAGRIRVPKGAWADAPFRLFTHCTERTSTPRAPRHWQGIFAAFGLTLEVQATGCCGMAGLFGHEREHAELSSRLFEMSWRPKLAGIPADRVLATGFSCRCQTRRMADFRPRHPAEALLAHLPNSLHP